MADTPKASQPLQAVYLNILVADDDPCSRRFLCDGLHAMGARTAACGNGQEALERAHAERFDLLLLDCRMPGAGALEIFNSLRDSAEALSADSMAVATTAELVPSDRNRLLGAGFCEILLKPCTLNDLQRVLTLASRSDVLIDEDAALRCSGDVATMHALRRLLREELVLLAGDLDRLSLDRVDLGERLHRLRSSCGFCGAIALSTQTARLQRQLVRTVTATLSVENFRRALLATIQALDR